MEKNIWKEHTGIYNIVNQLHFNDLFIFLNEKNS